MAASSSAPTGTPTATGSSRASGGWVEGWLAGGTGAPEEVLNQKGVRAMDCGASGPPNLRPSTLAMQSASQVATTAIS